MDNKESVLFSKIKIGRKLELKNRIAMAPVYLGSKYLTTAFVDFFLRRADGGAGLLIIPIPTFGGFSDLSRKEFIDWARPFIEKCHSRGCRIVPQIFSGPGEKVNDFTTAEIDAIPGSFAEGAESLRDIGFDGMEIHGAHHSFFMHLLSPILNRRSDRFGGDFFRRTEIQTTAVKRIRETVGDDFPLFFRFSSTEFVNGGVDQETAVAYAELLEKAGVDCLHVTAGGTGASPKYSDCPDETNEEGCFSPFSFNIKKKVKVPVIVAGRIASKKTAEMIINEKRADIVSLGRVLIADPDWADKIYRNREETIVSINKWYDIYKEECRKFNS